MKVTTDIKLGAEAKQHKERGGKGGQEVHNVVENEKWVAARSKGGWTYNAGDASPYKGKLHAASWWYEGKGGDV